MFQNGMQQLETHKEKRLTEERKIKGQDEEQEKKEQDTAMLH